MALFATDRSQTPQEISRMRRFCSSIAAIALALGLAGVASADVTWTFEEDGMNKDLTPTATFTESGFSITATGYNLASTSPPLTLVGATSHDLFSKFSFADPSETGLGLTNTLGTIDHELTPSEAIKIDFSSAIAATGSQTISVSIGSVQAGEGFVIYASDGTTVLASVPPDPSQGVVNNFEFAVSTAGTALFVTGNGNQPVSSGDVLITGADMKFNAIPEPSTLAIAGIGALGFGAHAWRRRRAGKGKKA
jgi:hypothetical protein